MTIYIIFTSLFSFIIAFMVQIIIWRICKPKRQILWLFSIFLFLPSFLLIIFGNWLELSFINNLETTLLCFSIVAAYIQTYPALKEDIPSFRILLLLKKQKKMTKEQIIYSMKTENLFSVKLDELENDNLVVMNDNKFELSPNGRRLANMFYYYRKILGLEQGKG